MERKKNFKSLVNRSTFEKLPEVSFMNNGKIIRTLEKHLWLQRGYNK